jgi:hypothetical protein
MGKMFKTFLIIGTNYIAAVSFLEELRELAKMDTINKINGCLNDKSSVL